MKADYIWFYLQGRDAKKLKADVDTAQIAEHVAAGKGTIHELCAEAAKKAATSLEVDRFKRRWLEDYDTEISAAGGDKEAAYEHYTQGRVDELVAVLENEVLEELDAEFGDESDDDEEDGDEDDEDGE